MAGGPDHEFDQDRRKVDALRREAVVEATGIVEKKMFGGYCWMIHGNMLCGVEVGRFMFRVGKEQEEDALSRPGLWPMDITGKPMKGFVWVSAAEAAGDRLEDWIDLAARYVAALPATSQLSAERRAA